MSGPRRRRPHRRIGREAIEIIKTAYRDGTEFDGVRDIQRYVIAELGIRPTWATLALARDWDRQARLENADENYANTSPSHRTGYRRNPNADQHERTDSHYMSLQYMATRSANELRVARAAAAQMDASRIEIARAAQLEIVAPMLRRIMELNGS